MNAAPVPVMGKGASSSTCTRCGPDSVGGLVKSINYLAEINYRCRVWNRLSDN